MKADTDNLQINKHGCVSIKTGSWPQPNPPDWDISKKNLKYNYHVLTINREYFNQTLLINSQKVKTTQMFSD